MSKYFDKFEKHINNVTAKFINEQTTDMYNVRTNLKSLTKIAKNKSKKFSFSELKSIWFSINTLGTKAAGKLVGVENLPVLADWVTVSQAALIDDYRSPSKANMSSAGVDNVADYVQKVYGGDGNFAFKEINRYAKTIVDNIGQGLQGKQLGTVDTTKDVGIGFTLQQLGDAIDIADGKDISVVDALSQVTGKELTAADVETAFQKVSELGNQIDNDLKALTDAAEEKIVNIKKTYRDAPEYTTTFNKRVLNSLSMSDIFRTDTGSRTVAYAELKKWATTGNPSWQQQLVSLIPTIDAVAPIINSLKGKQKDFELTQEQRALIQAAKQEAAIRDAIRQKAKDKVASDDAASQETDIRNAIRQAAQEAADRKRAGEEEAANRNFIRAEAKRIAKEKNLAAEQEKAIRDAIRNAAEKTATDNKAAADQETAIRDAIRATAARIAKENRLATEQETAIRDAIRQAAQETADRFRAGEEEAANRNFIRAEAKRIATENKLAAEQEKAVRNAIRNAAKNVGASAIAARDQDLYGADDDTPYDQRYDADTDQDFLGDPEVGPEGGTGVGRSDDLGGYLEMARREFDKALANTKGPTRGDGALETARRIYDTAIKNTPGPTRGNYGARLEMARRAYLQAIKNTLDTGRGAGFKEMARRAFDTALKNTLDTGRGSGENEVDRRYIDNVRSDINKWMATNRVPNDSTGGFVGAASPDADNSARDQVDAAIAVHKEIVNMFDAEQGEARASYILRLTREIDNTESELLDPANREKYINNLKQTYVKYKAQEDFLNSQSGNSTLYYGFNPRNLNSIAVTGGKPDFNLSDRILYSLSLLTQVVPDAIQKHSTEQSVIDANEPVDLDVDQLDQEAQARTAKLEQAVQELDDQGAARDAAGEEELANRDEIRADAQETAKREQERRRIISGQLKTFKEIEAETTSNEAAFDAVIEPLNVLVSNIESDVAGIEIDELANMQIILDAEFSEKAKIISNAITGKEEFEELDERLYKVIIERQKQFIEKINTTFDRLTAESQSEDADIDSDYIFGVDTTKLRADVDAFSTIDNMPNNFVSSTTNRINQIDDLVEKMQKRYKFYNDEFMVLHREVNEVILSSWDDITKFDYDDLVDLNEDVEDLFELSQTTDRSDRQQQIVDNKYDAVETNVGKLIRRKAYNFAERLRDVRDEIVTKTRIDAIDIIEGDLVLTPEAFDELYNRRDEVAGLVEEFEILQELLETVEVEEPGYFTQLRGWFDTLAGFYQKIEEYAADTGGPSRRKSPSDAYRYYKKTLGKVREPARAGFAGRGAPSPEARAELKGKGAVRFWEGNRDNEGLPLVDKEGNQLGSFSDRKAQFRRDIAAMGVDDDGGVVDNGIKNGIRKLLAWRRVWQLYTNNFVDNPSQDKFLKHMSEQMKRNNKGNSNFSRQEIQALRNNKRAVEYLDKLKDQYHG